MTRVYRLDVTYPPGSSDPGWEPEGWRPERYEPVDPDHDLDQPEFRWPRVRRYLSRQGAEERAAQLRSYGATVTVVASDPVTWPDGGSHG